MIMFVNDFMLVIMFVNDFFFCFCWVNLLFVSDYVDIYQAKN